MIRQFEEKDLEFIDVNEFSDIGIYRNLILSDFMQKATLVDGEKVLCVICYMQYADYRYKAFFIMSKDFTAKYARELKKFVYFTAKELKAKRVETESLDCELINRWHRFLGMTLEGKKTRFLDDETDFNLWSILWE